MRYSLWLLERPPFSFPLLKSPSSVANQPNGLMNTGSPFSTPTRDDWKRLWACWDLITRQMIPHSMLFQKPIDLRHICLFYLGHIPTFLDIHLSRLLQQPHTKPEEFKVSGGSISQSSFAKIFGSTFLRFGVMILFFIGF